MAFHTLLVLFLFTAFVNGDERTTYIVHMDPSSRPSPFPDPRRWYESTLSANRLAYVYQHAARGFSARLSRSELAALRLQPGFLSSAPDRILRPDTTHTQAFMGLSTLNGLWPAARYGADVIIGVVDSGVAPHSPSFNDAGLGPAPATWRGSCHVNATSLCNNKVIGARLFNKGHLAGHPGTVTVTEYSVTDGDGHGTHTASTAAGSAVDGASYFGYAAGTARGTAPSARLAIYKVMWDGGAFSSDVLAAVDAAISDGVHVISLSLGLDGVPLYDDPVAVAAFAAVKKGIFIAASAGNHGPAAGGLHNAAPWLLTVGAGTVDRYFSVDLTLGNGAVISGASLYPGGPLSFAPLVSGGGCEESSRLITVRGKIAVCEVNGTVSAVIDRLSAVGVAGGVFVVIGRGFSDSDLLFSFPGVVIGPKEGQILARYMRSGPGPTARFGPGRTSLNRPGAPAVPVYSSRGPGWACPGVVKPDIIAPGSLVLAAWPSTVPAAGSGGRDLYCPFNLMSGSSMACPHAAGVAALVRAARPDWTPAAIRSAMVTTAQPLDNSGGAVRDLSGRGRAATPLDMGSGQVSPNRALDPGLVYDSVPDDYVGLLCAMNYTVEQIRAVTGSAGAVCDGKSADPNHPSFMALFGPGESPGPVRRFGRTLTNVAEGRWSYRARVVAVTGLAVRVTPQVLLFEGKGQTRRFEVTVRTLVRLRPNQVLHGALVWEDESGKHTVRSPIVATWPIPLPSQPMT